MDHNLFSNPVFKGEYLKPVYQSFKHCFGCILIRNNDVDDVTTFKNIINSQAYDAGTIFLTFN